VKTKIVQLTDYRIILSIENSHSVSVQQVDSVQPSSSNRAKPALPEAKFTLMPGFSLIICCYVYVIVCVSEVVARTPACILNVHAGVNVKSAFYINAHYMQLQYSIVLLVNVVFLITSTENVFLKVFLLTFILFP